MPFNEYIKQTSRKDRVMYRLFFALEAEKERHIQEKHEINRSNSTANANSRRFRI